VRREETQGGGQAVIFDLYFWVGFIVGCVIVLIWLETREDE